MTVKHNILAAILLLSLSATGAQCKYSDCILLNIFHGNPKTVMDFNGSMNAFLSDGSDYFSSTATYDIDSSKKTLVYGQYLKMNLSELQRFDTSKLEIIYDVTAVKQ